MTQRDHHWRDIDTMIAAQDTFTEVSQSFVDSLATRVEYAVTNRSSATLGELDRQLTELSDHLLDTAPERVSKFLHSAETADFELNAALIVGQISFAQQLITQAASHRADDAFAVELSNPSFSAYLAALLKEAKTNGQLELVTSEATATVSRKLARLRELGITDFRKEGTRVVNFLTPIARAFLQQASASTNHPNIVRAGPINAALAKEIGKLPSHLRSPVTFATSTAFATKTAFGT